ncbi:hypothetical protein ACXWO6_10320, partial [Streptococcus pyogenes]
MRNISDTTLTARVCNASVYGGGTECAYFIDCGTASDMNDLNEKISVLTASGVEAFGAYYNSAL